MESPSFEKLLIKTAFCCMASNGNLDNRRISMISNLCENSPMLQDFNFKEEIDFLVSNIKTFRKKFILHYLDLLSTSSLTEKEEIAVIDIAIQTINSTEQNEYEPIKMFKKIRQRLKLNDEAIIDLFPDIEQFLEEDNIQETYLDKISSQYLKDSVIPNYELLQIFNIGFPVEE